MKHAPTLDSENTLPFQTTPSRRNPPLDPFTMANVTLLHGLEVEFYVPARDPGVTASNVDARLLEYIKKDKTHHRVATHLQYMGMNAAIMQCTDPATFVTKMVANARPGMIWRDILAVGEEPIDASGIWPGYHYWMIKDELDLTPIERWVSTACSSPIVKVDDSETVFTDALTAIHELVKGKVQVTEECGMHFHFSVNGDISLQFAKRVVTLVYLLEDYFLFELVHPRRRNSNSILSFASHLVIDTIDPDDIAPEDEEFVRLPATLLQGANGPAMRQIWAATSLGDLENRLRSAGDENPPTALSLRQHEHPDGTEDWSVEFRHAQATFSDIFLNNWRNVLARICLVAALPEKDFHYTVKSICNLLGNDKLTERQFIKFVMRVLRRTPGPSDVGLDDLNWETRLNDYVDEADYAVDENRMAVLGAL